MLQQIIDQKQVNWTGSFSQTIENERGFSQKWAWLLKFSRAIVSQNPPSRNPGSASVYLSLNTAKHKLKVILRLRKKSIPVSHNNQAERLVYWPRLQTLPLLFSLFCTCKFYTWKIEGEREPGMEPRPPVATWLWSWWPRALLCTVPLSQCLLGRAHSVNW